MKKIIFLLIIITALPLSRLLANEVDNEIPPFDLDEVKSRLTQLDQFIIDIDYEDKIIQSYIRRYVIRSRKSSARILGRTATFFPLFEQKIAAYNLPTELKFLALVESALDPQAVSPVGAGGLWQFMPGTGKEFGLKINADIDERMDPVKATDAAMRYLIRLHKRYDDWALALAAYNSGPGRVNYAIKRSKSKDFWVLKKYLPRETRNYVPAFIASIYLFQYQKAHNIQAEATNIDLQITDHVEITNFMSYYRIAQITGISLATIRQLNPGYKKDFIPANKTGNFVILPARVCSKFKQYLVALENGEWIDFKQPVFLQKKNEKDTHYNYSNYHLMEGESLRDFAKSIGCSISQLMAWNEGLDYFQKTSKSILVYRSNAWRDEQPKPIKMPLIPALEKIKIKRVESIATVDYFRPSNFIDQASNFSD